MDSTYGAPRITAELRQDGGPLVNYQRIARIMRAIRLEGVRLRRQHRTTVADPAAAKAPDLIGHDFTTTAVNANLVLPVAARCTAGRLRARGRCHRCGIELVAELAGLCHAVEEHVESAEARCASTWSALMAPRAQTWARVSSVSPGSLSK